MAATVQRRAPHAARIALETGPMSAWHYRSLMALGLPMVCVDARHAKAALAMQLNKTDANDAVGLAQIVRTGWYREVAVKSEHGHRIRGLGVQGPTEWKSYVSGVIDGRRTIRSNFTALLTTLLASTLGWPSHVQAVGGQGGSEAKCLGKATWHRSKEP